jgi:predicted RNase H-like HicB family nuclease
MSSKSKNSRKAIDRPFASTVVKQAKEVAAAYQIIIQFQGGEYFGRGLELPYVMNDGKTPDECVAATRDSLVTAVAHMLEIGEKPPAPASDRIRSEQINIRLTPEEKLLIDETARSRGFKGIGDFVRSTTLASIR